MSRVEGSSANINFWGNFTICNLSLFFCLGNIFSIGFGETFCRKVNLKYIILFMAVLYFRHCNLDKV